MRASDWPSSRHRRLLRRTKCTTNTEIRRPTTRTRSAGYSEEATALIAKGMALFDTPGRLTLGDTYENAVAHDRDWLPLDRDALLSSLPAAPVASRLAWSFSRVMLAPSSVMGYSGINARQMSSSPSGTIDTSTCVGMNLAAFATTEVRKSTR